MHAHTVKNKYSNRLCVHCTWIHKAYVHIMYVQDRKYENKYAKICIAQTHSMRVCSVNLCMFEYKTKN